MLSPRSGLIRIIGSQWAAAAYGSAIMFLMMIFLARRLGPSSLAIFLYVQAIASLLAIIQDGGFQTLLFREKISSSDAMGVSLNDLSSGYFSYVILVTVLASTIALLSPVVFKSALLLAIIYFAFRCITNMVSSLLKGQGSFIKEALWRFQINTLIVVSVVLIIGITTPTPEKVFLGFIIGQLILFSTKQNRELITRPKWTLPPWRIWKTCLSFIIISGATMLYFRSGIVLLKHLQPDLDLVGYYGAAFQVLEGVIILATPIAHLLFRYMRLNWRDRDRFAGRFTKSLFGVFIAALWIAVPGIIFAPTIVILIFGDVYKPAADILPILLLSLIFLLPNFILTQGIIALNGERYYAFAAFCCAIFNVGLNLVLIPHYLAHGAAFATIATEVLLMILLGIWFVRWRRSDATRHVISGKNKKQEKRENDNHIKCAIEKSIGQKG